MPHATAARSKASINIPLRPRDSGGTGGRGRERGALSVGAVVITVTVTAAAVLPAVTGFGETVQTVSAGAPAQAKLTVPDNPPKPPKLKLYAPACPGATVTEVEELEDAVKVKS